MLFKNYQHLQISPIEKEQSILVLNINHPPLNILTPDLLKEMGDALQSFIVTESVKALIITGSGDRAFSMGADINEIYKISDSKSGKTLALFGQALFNKIEIGRASCRERV